MEYKVSFSSESQFEKFVRANYSQFDPSFQEMSESTYYCHKLYTKSTIYECWEDNDLVGVLCVYVNNEKKFAYIPYLCISSQFTQKGIASKLLHNIFLLKGIDRIELEVRIKNQSAYNLYIKNGFLEIGRNQEKIQLKRFL